MRRIINSKEDGLMGLLSWRFYAGLILLCSLPRVPTFGYSFQNPVASGAPANGGETLACAPPCEAVLELNSNRIVWRDGAQGALSFTRGGMDSKLLVYGGRTVRAHLQLWGDYMLGYVQVINQDDAALVIDTRHAISVHVSDRSSSTDSLLPIEPEAFARQLEKDSKRNKQLAKQIREGGSGVWDGAAWVARQRPSPLGSVTIQGKSTWEGLFYFAFRDSLDARFMHDTRYSHKADFQVEVGGIAFIFPSKL
jgi:hypothetical protein